MSHSRERIARQILIIAINFVLTVMGGCSKLVSPLTWQATPITVDGKLNDWKLPLPQYDMKSKLNYSITNDAQNLYICVKATEEESQMKILRGGLFIWVDTSGKKKHMAGIEFPMPQQRAHTGQQQHAQAGSGEKPDPTATRHRIMTEQTQMQLSGFKDTNNGLSPLHNANGITVALGWDSTGILIYEACIPFKTFYKEALSTGDVIKKPWSIGILLNGIAAGAGGHSGGGGGGSRGGGMGGGGGMHGGGMGGGMHGGGGSRGGSGGESSTLSENQSIWEYVKPNLRKS